MNEEYQDEVDTGTPTVLPDEQTESAGDVIERDFEEIKSQRTGLLTKVEKSPAYDDIIRAYLIERRSGRFTLHRFWQTLVRKIDPELSEANVATWINKVEKKKAKIRGEQARIMAADSISSDATIENIRDASIKIFYSKVIEFVKDPDQLEKMSFDQALKLLKAIEKIAIDYRKLALDEHSEKRKDVFAIFSLQGMSGQVTEDDLDQLEASTYGALPAPTPR